MSCRKRPLGTTFLFLASSCSPLVTRGGCPVPSWGSPAPTGQTFEIRQISVPGWELWDGITEEQSSLGAGFAGQSLSSLPLQPHPSPGSLPTRPTPLDNSVEPQSCSQGVCVGGEGRVVGVCGRCA